MPALKQSAVLRGELYWTEFDPTIGAEIQKIRPAVVVSSDSLNRARRTVIVVPLSTSATVAPPINVALTGGSVARCDHLRSLDKQRLKNKIGTLHSSDLKAIEYALRQVMVL